MQPAKGAPSQRLIAFISILQKRSVLFNHRSRKLKKGKIFNPTTDVQQQKPFRQLPCLYSQFHEYSKKKLDKAAYDIFFSQILRHERHFDYKPLHKFAIHFSIPTRQYFIHTHLQNDKRLRRFGLPHHHSFHIFMQICTNR